MPSTLTLATTLVDSKASAFAARFNGGFFDMYDGLQPADADDPITAQTRLARLTLQNPAWSGPVGGVLTLQPMGQDISADASGVAAWGRFRALDETALMDASVDLAVNNPNIVIDDVNIVAGTVISAVVGTFVYIEPKS